MDIQEYYKNNTIREGLDHFFRGSSWFLVGGSQFSRDPNWGSAPHVMVFPINEFWQKIGVGPDIFRPLINNSGVLGVFDIEYQHANKLILLNNHDEIFKNLLEPVYKEIESAFGNESISDMTWSGYHFLTQIDRNSFQYGQLLDLAHWQGDGDKTKCLGKSLITSYSKTDSSDIKRLSKTKIEDAVVYEMYGRVLEYLSHKVIKNNKSALPIPVTICDSETESISLDLSQYADPVYMRIIRSVFSSWDKHNIYPGLNGYEGKPPLVDIIRKFRDYKTDDLNLLFRCSTDYDLAIQHTQFNNLAGEIPKAGENVSKLICDYRYSPLSAIHKNFDRVCTNELPDHYHKAKFYDGIDQEFRNMMWNPNPELMKPSNLKRLTEHLMYKNWHPKHIGGLVAAFYRLHSGDFHNQYWEKYNPEKRAEFWARIYSSLKIVEL